MFELFKNTNKLLKIQILKKNDNNLKKNQKNFRTRLYHLEIESPHIVYRNSERHLYRDNNKHKLMNYEFANDRIYKESPIQNSVYIVQQHSPKVLNLDYLFDYHLVHHYLNHFLYQLC